MSGSGDSADEKDTTGSSYGGAPTRAIVDLPSPLTVYSVNHPGLVNPEVCGSERAALNFAAAQTKEMGVAAGQLIKVVAHELNFLEADNTALTDSKHDTPRAPTITGTNFESTFTTVEFVFKTGGGSSYGRSPKRKIISWYKTATLRDVVTQFWKHKNPDEWKIKFGGESSDFVMMGGVKKGGKVTLVT